VEEETPVIINFFIFGSVIFSFDDSFQIFGGSSNLSSMYPIFETGNDIILFIKRIDIFYTVTFVI
jgi:hypothetical protein